MPVLPTKSELLKLVDIGVGQLYRNDCFLLKQDVFEASVSQKLAQYMSAKEWELDVDTEFDVMAVDPAAGQYVAKNLARLRGEFRGKRRTGDVRPDIIVHHRPNSDFNALVVEVKIAGRGDSGDREWACRKLMEFTKPKSDLGLGYSLGILIEFHADRAASMLFEAGHQTAGDVLLFARSKGR